MVSQYLLEVLKHCPPFLSLEALLEESILKKEKAEKVYFYFGTGIEKKHSRFQISASPDLEQSLTKNKKELQQALIDMFLNLHSILSTLLTD